MEKSREDRRTSYSKMVIRESLFELAKTKPLNKISVKEICEKADVNRCTFYSYYTDIFDLHNKLIEEFYKKQTEVIENAKQVLDKKRGCLDTMTKEDFYLIYHKYFVIIKENHTLYEYIFSYNTDNKIHADFGKHFFEALSEYLAPAVPEHYRQRFKNSYAFISGGLTALIMQWLARNCDQDIDLLSKQVAYYNFDIFLGYKYFTKYGEKYGTV